MFISIDGLISAGKTETLIKYMQLFPVFNQENNIWVKFEPVKQFMKYEYDGMVFNPLELFYTNDAYQFVFEDYVLDIYSDMNEGFKTSLEADPGQIFILERNLASARVFIETNRHNYNDFEYARLIQKHDRLHKKFYANECTTDHLFYLDCDIDICLDRISKRCRRGEDKISYEYMQSLNDNYKMYMSKCKSHDVPVHVQKAGSVIDNAWALYHYLESIIKK